MYSWARTLALGAVIFTVLLMIMICAWGSSHLLAGCLVAAGGVLLVLALRGLLKVLRTLREVNRDLISSPFRFPAQERDEFRP